MNPTLHHTFRRIKSTHGGILITTVLLIVMMTMMTSAILYRVSSRHAATYMSVVWNEALSSAEAGSDFAVQALNNSIASPGTAWTGWTPSDATTFPKTINFNPSSHIGEGNTKIFAKLTVDNTITDSSGAKWMRIRSQGVAECPHITNGTEAGVLDSNGVKNHRTVLRKARFTTASDITGGLLHLPQVTRTVEVMAKPPGSSLYIRAITTQNEIKLAVSPFFVDSFDSTNNSKSSGGLWAVNKRQSNGDVASNSSGGISNLDNAAVWGDASSNTGAMAGTTNVKGAMYNNFSTTIPTVTKPTFASIIPLYAAITNPAVSVTLVGGPASAPVNYKLTDLTIGSTGKLILDTHLANTDSYINIWVTGNTTVGAANTIQQNPKVHVNFYCEGSIIIGATGGTGAGWDNQTKTAANLMVYGVEPAVYSTRDFRVNMGTFYGVFNGGKTFDITMAGSATFVGAAIGRETDMTGCTGAFHYDEALSSVGANGSTVSSTYSVSSWVEDIR